MQAAVQCHRASRIEQARRLCELVSHRDDNNAFARHSLGVAAYQEARYDEAVDLTRKTIAAYPGVAEFHNSIGVVFKALGKVEEAISAYDQAIQLKPNCAQAHWNKALALLLSGNLLEGIPLAPQSPSEYCHLPAPIRAAPLGWLVFSRQDPTCPL